MKINTFLTIVFIVVFAACTAFSIAIFSRRGSIATIYEDGQALEKIDLAKVTKSYYLNLPHNKILVEPGQISVTDADCPDKLCIKQGKRGQGMPIVCLPNKVYIVFSET